MGSKLDFNSITYARILVYRQYFTISSQFNASVRVTVHLLSLSSLDRAPQLNHQANSASDGDPVE